MTENPHDAIARAIGDPGSILERREGETVTRWSARAVAEILDVAYGVDREGHFPNTRASLALMKHAELRGELKRANDLLSDAWGIIANAENFKHTLVCEHGHRCQDREGHAIDELTPEPIGPQVWRDAAVSWRDRWHAFMDVTATFPMDVATDCPHGYAVGKVCGVCGSGVPSDGEQDATMGDDENEELTPTERAQIAEFGAGLRAGMAEGGAEAVRHPRGAAGVRPAGGAAGEA